MNKDRIENIVFSVQNKRQYVSRKKIYTNKEGIGYVIDTFTHGNIIVSDTLNVSNCLFYDDIKKWDSIKDKPLVKYIQEKLEFFDFEWENKMNQGDKV